jgi:ABC-type Fe3+-hydroxamate transport system substrate-binding protein
VAGGINVLAPQNMSDYPRISLETVLRLRPDVVIDTADMGATDEERRQHEAENLALWQREPLVKAAGLREIHTVTTDALVVPGPRVVEAAQWLLDLIHPRARPR